ncbi:facilitated trehalose transporter Tret1-like isoform X2 [Rhodnius prolixus]|uniref:facilitated trehalose transporter Tret1-like isoform X2 n=1 Tax=Rhodnius prolixus TaxID=13249 RepID=UPI003D187CFB
MLWKRFVGWLVAASISVIVLGTSLGWPSPVLVKLRESGQPMSLTDEQVSWMVSLLYVGNLASPLPAGLLMDKFGRKHSLLYLAIIPLVAWTIILYAVNPYMLYFARFLTGIWSGTVSTITPMYLAEISQPKIRGALSTFVQIMTNIGVILEYIVGPYVSYKNLAIISGSLPVAFILTFWYMPESQYWQLMHNRKFYAAKNLAWLRGFDNVADVKEEIEIISVAVQEEMKNKRSLRALVQTKGNRRALLIVEALATMQRMSGISALMAYSSITLPEPGAGRLSPNDCVIVMGLVWVVCVFIATIFVDSVGRKPLLFLSSIGCSIAMLFASLWFLLNDNTSINVTDYYWIPFASFLLYGLCFSIGLGPIASTMQGELFPTNIKATASGITSVILALTSFIMNKIYHTIAYHIGMYFNYLIFSIASLTSAVFVLMYVIETKGKTLAQIQEILNKK